MIDFKRKPNLGKKGRKVQDVIDKINDEDAIRYGYIQDRSGKVTYYCHDKNDPYLDIYYHNEKSIKLAKQLCNCLFDMQRAIEIDYGVDAKQILEKQSLGEENKDIAWYNYWMKLEKDISKLDSWIELCEQLLLENNKNPINANTVIEPLLEKYNIVYESTRFMPVGFIAYDPRKDVILNISPDELTKKEVKRMIKELKEAEKLEKK